MRKNAVRAACYRGEVSVGSFVAIADPVSAQILARSGYAWLVIDMEHGPIALESLGAIVNAIRATSAEPFVRAAWNTSAAIQVALDYGASGVMVPMVNTAGDARRAVEVGIARFHHDMTTRTWIHPGRGGGRGRLDGSVGGQ